MLTKTFQIEKYLTDSISNGKFQIGKKIPSRNLLCRRFQCSRTVVERAVNILISRGFLTGRKGSGTYVASTKGSGGTIRTLKIISDFQLVPENSQFIPFLDFCDLNISVEWIPLERAVAEVNSFCAPGTAVISLRPDIPQIPILEQLKRRKIPVLLVNRDYEGFDCIVTDPRSSIREGLSWLLSVSGRDIAFVSRRPHMGRPYTGERILCFYETAVDFGLHLKSVWCQSRKFENFTDDVADVGRSLFAGSNCPEGIFILGSDLVLPVVNCGQGYGMSPGKDYKLLTFDHIPNLAGCRGVAMMKQQNLLYEKGIRSWIHSVNSGIPFRLALKTDLQIF